MPSVEKIIQKMKNQPNGIILQEAEKVLKNFGYQKQRTKGSHNIFYNDMDESINIPVHGKGQIKPIYVKKILDKIEEGSK
ncbi:MAG: type II toxin-antitoxin system HicA family toxin [Oscillospiraceae bacterium]|nr:type II toxin-antitoxin system HicA family toxin [Oscillospiraceae bacterium]